jgi:hypothetical protein
MVKRIKKRVPKSNVDTQSNTDSSELEGAEGPDGTESSPNGNQRLLAEINANANSESSDRFSELAEGFFLGLAEHWVIAVMLGVVGIGVYGFIQYNDQQHTQSLASSRADLQSELTKYQQLQNKNQAAWSAQAATNQPQLPGLSVTPTVEIDQPKPEAFSKIADQFKTLKTSGLSAPLATLAQASALFDAARSSDEYVKAAELFTKAAQQSDQIEVIAQGIALRNAAIAYEEAARAAGGKGESWAKAINAWKEFGATNEIYSLTAQVNQARVMRLSKDKAGARKLYQEIKRNHAKLPTQRELNQQVKIGLALTADVKTSKPKSAGSKKSEAKKSDSKPAQTQPASK